MIILSLDISTKTGYSICKSNGDGYPDLIHYGVYVDEHRVGQADFEKFDKNSVFSIIDSGVRLYKKVEDLINEFGVDTIVIEQTNHLSKNRFSQKILEWYHFQLIVYLDMIGLFPHFLNTSEWRSLSDCKMTKDDRKNNQLVKNKKKRGKITPKHVAVRRVLEIYNVELKQIENDIADAILMGVAYDKKCRISSSNLASNQTSF